MLANKALLANLRISAWTGRKLDRVATDTVKTKHDTQDGAGNYTKKLLPGADELAAIERTAKAIRVFFYEQTLPWFSDGTRILAGLNYMDFTTAFRKHRDDYQAAVTAFLGAYPALQEAARAKLGDLYRETEYPSIAYLKNAFECDISFMPVPAVGDFRVEILDTEKDAFMRRMREVETTAMRECWTRLHDVVSKAAMTLSQDRADGKPAIFRDSLIQNISDMCALLPKLNVTDDADLEAMRVKVEKLVSTISPDTCRESVIERQDVAAKLADITSKMSVFMGAN